MEEKKYIYSIVNYSTEMRDSGPLHFATGMLGINNRVITLIPYRDIAAIVSNTHLINFDKLDRKELTRLIAIHEQANSRLLEKRDTIPMRFGMIAENTEEIRNILAKAYIQFKTVLEKITGKAEFIVQIFWNENNTLEKIVRENAEIQKLKKSADSKGRILGFSSKMKLGKRIFEAIEARRKEYTTDILGNLAAYFPDFSAGPLRSRLSAAEGEPRPFGREASPLRPQSEASKLLGVNKEGAVDKTEKEMIMNYSFLVGKTEESTLEFHLNKLAEKYKNELKFKYIGPMAPYSFAAINLGMGNFDLVDNARKTLGLGEFAAFPEIINAYHKLAHEHHPDKQFLTKDQVILEKTEKKMKDIITANEILTVYCKHYLSALTPEKEQLCSFKQEDIEDSIIISA